MTKKELAEIDRKFNSKISPFKFDTTKTYIIPMRPKADRLNRNVEAVETECHIMLKERRVIIVERPDLVFADDNFNWYLYTGYIKIKAEG